MICARNRSTGGGDAGRSAYFQSVLTDVVWGDVTASPCLTQIEGRRARRNSFRSGSLPTAMSRAARSEATAASSARSDLTSTDEPHTFVMGRHLRSRRRRRRSIGRSNSLTRIAVVDAARRKILVDVGNLLKVDAAGDFTDLGELTLRRPAAARLIGTVSYKDPGGYATTAGIFELPQGRATHRRRTRRRRAPAPCVSWCGRRAPPRRAFSPRRRRDGVYVRAEKFVFRLDDGASDATDLVVTRFGAPVANATAIDSDAFHSPASTDLPLPDVTAAAKTDAKGRTKLADHGGRTRTTPANSSTGWFTRSSAGSRNHPSTSANCSMPNAISSAC